MQNHVLSLTIYAMRFTLFFLFLSIFHFSYGQLSTLKETEKYINDKVKIYDDAINSTKTISIQKSGLVTIKVRYNDSSLQEWMFELKKVRISLDFYSRDGEKTDENVVLFSCQNDECVKFNYYKSSNLNNSKIINEYGLGLSNNEETKNIFRAFLKAKSLVK